MSRRTVRVALAGLTLSAVMAACGSGSSAPTGAAVTLRLLTHDSFVLSDGLLADFTRDTGIKVELLQGGDAGTVVNQAILTKGSPQADLLFGIDSTLLTRALAADLFLPYRAPDLAHVDDSLLLDPEHRVTPVDYGDVCVNYDKQFFTDSGLAVPRNLLDLADPRYEGLLVVENPATSSPGLAFLLASIDEFGDGWETWWTDLRANDVEVVDGWEQAYNQAFSGGGASQGDRPLVVSYASSPPAEVLYADPPIDEPPTGVVESTCYRQVEGVGILAGTDHEAEAGRLIDFLLSTPVQADVPLSMFVFPARSDVALPEVFTRHAARPADVRELPAAEIDAHREEWIGRWTDLVLR